MYIPGYDVFGRNNYTFMAEKKAPLTFNASPTSSAWQSVNSSSQYSLAACMSGTSDWVRSGGQLPLDASGNALIAPNPNPMKSGGWHKSRWNTSCRNVNAAGERNTISTDCAGKDEGGWFWKTSDDWEAQVKIYMWDDNPSNFLGQVWKQGDATKLLKDNLKLGTTDKFTDSSKYPLKSQSFNLTLGKDEGVTVDLNKGTNPIKIIYNGATWIYTASGGSGAGGGTRLNWSNQNIQFRLSLNKVRYFKEGCTNPKATNYESTATIDDGKCYRDCIGSWNDWSNCSVDCGGGTKSRTYSVTTTPIESGKACPSSPETKSCNTQPCLTSVNCVGSWGEWSGCSADCGGGKQTRKYYITTPASNGGTACPESNGTTQEQDCNTQNCGIDCEVSAWSDWGDCEAGTISRTRTIITAAEGNGQGCPALTETQSCTQGGSPIDCVVSNWSNWGSCVSGKQSRSRTITTSPTNGGKSCGALNDSKSCTTPPPVAGTTDEFDWEKATPYIGLGAIALIGIMVLSRK